MLHPLDATAAGVDVADDRPHMLFGHGHFDGHHRLQQHRTCLPCSFLKSDRSSNLECHFVRIDIVVAAVVENCLEIDNLVAGENAAMQRLANTLLGRLDVFLRNYAALDLVDKLETLTRLVRLQTNPHVAVVARTTRLANVLALGLSGLANRLAESDPRFAHIGFNLMLALHAVDENLKMQL